jgi:hypothetical protein
MSNEVNVTEIFYGVLDPGLEIELYFWGDNNSYNKRRHKARFFSISPDPEIPLKSGGTLELTPDVLNFEITRVWNTVWVSPEDDRVFQSNLSIKNLGTSTAAYHIIQAETDN